jgi:hypothetical protein
MSAAAFKMHGMMPPLSTERSPALAPRPNTIEPYGPNGKKSHIPRSHHKPKIARRYDSKVIGDRTAELRPVPRDHFTKKPQRGAGKFSAIRCPRSCGRYVSNCCGMPTSAVSLFTWRADRPLIWRYWCKGRCRGTTIFRQ